jgi:hypothetical protein
MTLGNMRKVLIDASFSEGGNSIHHRHQGRFNCKNGLNLSMRTSN